MPGKKQRGFAGITERASENTLSLPTLVTNYNNLAADTAPERTHSVPTPANPAPNTLEPSNLVVTYGDPCRIRGLNWKRIRWITGSTLVGALVLGSSLTESNRSTPSQPSYVSPSATMTGELKPPVGSGTTFTQDQIRYCLREKVRLEAAERVITSDGQVAIYNFYVDDYNSRCVKFRYRRGHLEAVQNEIAQDRLRLEAEGIARLR